MERVLVVAVCALVVLVVVRVGCMWLGLGAAMLVTVMVAVMVVCRLVGKLRVEAGCFEGGRILGEDGGRVVVGGYGMACSERGFRMGEKTGSVEGRILEQRLEAGSWLVGRQHTDR